MGKSIEITAADAAKLFRDVQVQVAKAVTVKGENGSERPGWKSEMKPLAESHILAVKHYGDRVTIVTIDGRRHEARV